MLSSELNILIQQIVENKYETQNIELKKAACGTPERLYDTLSAFANQSGGGIIVFGIDEKDNFSVAGVHDVQKLQVDVTNYALQMEPPIRPVFTVTTYEGKNVVSAEIPECNISEKPCFYKAAGRLRGSYVRMGESDQPMTEYEVYSYEAFRKKIRDELRIVERASADDFNQDLLIEYFSKLRQTKPILSKNTNEQILRLQGITENGRPTVAGLMILCDYPQAFFPQMSITAMVVNGTEIGVTGTSGERFIDNKRIEGNIPQMLDETMRFIRRNIRTATIIDQNGNRSDKPEYPLIAVREIILNALIHRDYSSHTEDSPIRVVLYKDRLEVENPGGLYGRLTINDLGKVPADTRNPFIAGNLEVMINTENRFSGIPTIYHEMNMAGLKPPVFESRRGNFKTILYNEHTGSSPVVENVENTVSAEYDNTSARGRILLFCQTPRTKEEIAEHLGIASVYYVVNKYLKPLCANKLLNMTIPEKPRSRSQKYFTNQ